MGDVVRPDVGRLMASLETRSTVFFTAVVFLFVEALGAQPVGNLAGQVTDSGGNPLLGVEIAIEGSSLRTITDERGSFRLRGVPARELRVRARRIGFLPAEISVSFIGERRDQLAIQLAPLAQLLAPVVVSRRTGKYSGRLAEYYERVDRRSGAYFITREEIDAANARSLAHLLRRVPGVTLLRGGGGSTMVRLRGRSCRPLVWIDGFALAAADVDLESFSANTLHGVEVYLGFSTPPLRYLSARETSNCGTILLWSRGPDTEIGAQNPDLLNRLENLVASAAVFTADQVERRATLDTVQSVEVLLPPDLLAPGAGDHVIAEFVVGRNGIVEESTVGIVSATRPRLANTVRQALPRLVYIPATRGGRPVRQLVHQRFDFPPRVAQP